MSVISNAVKDFCGVCQKQWRISHTNQRSHAETQTVIIVNITVIIITQFVGLNIVS